MYTPMTQHKHQYLIQIVKVLKAAYHLQHPAAETSVSAMKKSLHGHSTWVKHFKVAGKHSHFKCKLGGKYFYMHWLLKHSKQQCLHTLDCWGVHITAFCCQTTEHFNKILKRYRLIEHLHSLTHRPMCGSYDTT